jgi:hypothetical protein
MGSEKKSSEKEEEEDKQSCESESEKRGSMDFNYDDSMDRNLSEN